MSLQMHKHGTDVGKGSQPEEKQSVFHQLMRRQHRQPLCTIIQDVYIQIPLSVMSGNTSTPNKNLLISNEDESPSSPDKGQNVRFNYKLIEGFPSCADIRKRKSYVMSYNTETKNAEWVYEILNKSTLQSKRKENISFGKNELDNPDYHQGHLAAAANHRWCQEAYHDTYLMSNMIPQLSGSNQKIWKTLEKHCRDIVKYDSVCNVHLYTGPLYLERKGEDNYERVSKKSTDTKKVMPSHLFKVVFVEYNNGTVQEPECYMMPNEISEYEKKEEEKIELQKQAELSRKELLDLFKEHIEDIQEWSGLTFIKREPQYKDHIIKMIWTGEDENGESRRVTIEVKINTPHSSDVHRPPGIHNVRPKLQFRGIIPRLEIAFPRQRVTERSGSTTTQAQRSLSCQRPLRLPRFYARRAPRVNE